MPFINILQDGTVIDDMECIDFVKYHMPDTFIKLFSEIVLREENEILADDI